MSQLPNCQEANVPLKKLAAYLLASDHPQNKGKAKFYSQIGYSTINLEQLAKELLSLACSGELQQSSPHPPHGNQYVVVGEIAAPNGRSYKIKSVWIIETGTTIPRLVTAYPD